MIKGAKNIIISRTDSIGDVILTLPMAKLLKDHIPGVRIGFIGKPYTKPVIDACEYIDEFIYEEDFLGTIPSQEIEDWDAIIHVFPKQAIAVRAKEFKIRYRIGTTGRLYHWFTCNKLVKLSRKNSDLHEAQLNTKLLRPFGIDKEFSLQELGSSFGFTKLKSLPSHLAQLIDPNKYSVILHPKSQGSAREWGLDNFIALIRLLDKTRFQVFISGTEKERALLDKLFEQAGNEVTDITGKMNLDEFITFIDHCDALVANSTGPLHIASALGKTALGIYPPTRPMHPGRWAPIGTKAKYFVLDKDCADCRKAPASCQCIAQIMPITVAQALETDSAGMK